ncbi:CSC1-like protein At1g69450 [Rutidosis leptorrhynchoides]|uniref:CSC1-like protein At1g69450 n=1 Tax=Rutidosis leptorrhynchoides TaxID=125765 RepID=UPI003A9A503B
MIVSGLLTSVGINFALCIIFFTLYSVLRKQPGNYKVYAPRLLAEGKAHRPSRFHLNRLVPTPGWLKNAWVPSEDQLLSYSGLDAVVFMRIIIFSLKVFSIAGFIGIFILVPVNCSGNQLHDMDYVNITNNSLEVFSISNVNNGSNSLWIHLGAVYVVTIVVCYLLYTEYRYIASKRINYFCSVKPQPHQYTVLVSNIPVSKGSSVGASVVNFFTENHPATYLSHVVVHRKRKVWTVANAVRNYYRTFINHRRVKKIADAEVNLNVNVNLNVRIDKSREEVQAAFVSFKTRYGAAIALHMLQANNPTQWLTEQAPEPQDVYWPFFSSTFMGRWISKLLVILSCTLVTILFLIPVFIVQGLTNLAQLESYFPFLNSILTMSIVSQVITGYLPNLILQVSLKIVPPIMKVISSQQGYISVSEIERSACHKVIWFTVWNVFFANVLSASAFSLLFIFLEFKDIPSKLAVSVPAQASFFIAYVVTLGWTSTSSELFRVIPFVGSLLSKPCSKNSNENNFSVPSFPYHQDIPKILFFGLLGFTYFFLAPLIIPFLLGYFSLAYIIYRNQLLNVYAPKYESAGKFWPIVHDTTIFSLVLMQFIAFGIFTLKKLPHATAVTFPLPVFTLLFNEYCRKRFLPIFMAYSTETLLKKDKEDENDPDMAQFLYQLRSAYQHPALVPTTYSSSHSDTLHEPLIPTAQVRG